MVSASSRQIESVAHDAVTSAPGKHSFLYCQLSVCAAVKATSDFGIFPFIVFADYA